MKIEERKPMERMDQSRTYQIDQDALNRYKKILLKRVIWSFVLLFVVIIERIFSDYAQYTENTIVESLQSSFSLNDYNDSNVLMSIISFMDIFRYLILLLTHFYITFYFGINAVICMKILYVHMNSLVIIALLEILFGDPRPYWTDSLIVSYGCTDSYGFPSYNVFCMTFLVMYTRYCYNTDDDDEDNTNLPKQFLWGSIIIVLLLYSFLKLLSGDDYISQVLLAMLYCFLVYYMAVFFDKGIDNLVLKSTIQTDSAKRYSIFWMVYLIIAGAIGAIFYSTSNTFLDIEWFDNYFTCLNNRDLQITAPYYHLIGAWGSFLKSSVIYVLLGAIFGAAKTFRDMNGVFWYKTTTKNKIIMVVLANICLIPSWIISIFQSSIQGPLEDAGIDEYLFYAIHFSLLYFFLFGIMPKTIFARFRLITSNSGYVHAPDDLIRMRIKTASFMGPQEEEKMNINE